MEVDYHPGDQDRKVMGSVIPYISSKTIEKIYGDVPWKDWGSLVISRTHMGSGDTMVVPSRILSEFNSTARWDQILRRMFLIPNGQVKNFLVACRTFWGAGELKDVRVCFRGSKAHQGGGIWYLYYALWIATKSRSVVVECYDYAETPGTETFEWGGCSVTIIRIASPYDGDGSGYIAVIDDAYLPGSGIVSQLSYKSQFYSLKQIDGSFLHAFEGRFFSQTPVDGEHYCECMVCRVCSDVSTSYDEYVFLRRICTVLGHDSRCLNDPAQHELVLKGDTLREILSQPTFVIRPGQQARAIIALATEIPIKAISTNVVSYDPVGVPGDISFSHTLGVMKVRERGDVCHRLQGKRVMFVGVLPDVLGSTQLARKSVMNPYHSSWDVVFASNASSLKLNTAANVAFVPKSEQLGDDWHATGYEWKGFAEYSYVVSEVAETNLVLYVQGKKNRSLHESYEHPVPKRVELLKSSQVGRVFHWHRSDTSFWPIDSDFPLAHVYDDLIVRSSERGHPISPLVRTYLLKDGHYEGSYSSMYDPGLFQCLVEVRGDKMIWDFIGPQTWKNLTVVAPDALRALHHTDGYIGVSRSAGTPYITYVPPTWDSGEVSVASCLISPLRQSWGWCGQGEDNLKDIDFVQRLLKINPVTDKEIWFVRNGWKNYFVFDKRKHHVRIVGTVSWSRFYESCVSTVEQFLRDINSRFSLTVDGPYDSLLNLSLYDRSGRPKSKRKK